MKGIIGKKIGMTRVFDDEGDGIPCTVIEAGPCVVTEVRTQEKDGYEAVQLAFDETTEKNVPKPLIEHFKRASTTPKKKVAEIRNFEFDYELGDTVKAEDIFEEGELVKITGTSKGKGFQGVMKRHNFSGVGMQTHGQKDTERKGGSIGASADPSRVWKGQKMPGRMGNENVTMINLEVLKVIPEKNLMLVNGSVAGNKGSYVIIRKKH